MALALHITRTSSRLHLLYVSRRHLRKKEPIPNTPSAFSPPHGHQCGTRACRFARVSGYEVVYRILSVTL